MRALAHSLFAIALAALLRPAVGGKAPDIVVLQSGKHIAGEVVADSYEGVSIKVERGRVERRLNASQVRTVYYADRPGAYTEGIRWLEAGQYAAAAEKFREALGAPSRPWLKVYASFYLAESLALDRRYKQAIAMYRQCIESDRRSRFCFDALLGVGLCQLASGACDEAASTLQELSDSAVDERVRLMARLSRANALVLQGKHDQARSIYQTVEINARERPAAAGTAQLGVALIAAKLRAPGSDAMLQEALQRPAASVLKYLAWQLLARRAFEAKRYEEAMTAYLRADLYLSWRQAGGSFAGAPLEVASTSADRGEVLFRAAGCAELLNKPGEAIVLYEAVGRAAADSPWAAKAVGRLKTLQ